MSLKIVTYCSALGYITIKIIKNCPNSRKNICMSYYYLVYLQQIEVILTQFFLHEL